MKYFFLIGTTAAYRGKLAEASTWCVVPVWQQLLGTEKECCSWSFH